MGAALKYIPIRIKTTTKASDGSVTFDGLANATTVDRGKDLILKGAFRLDNYRKNPIMFFNHDPMLEVGAITDLAQTDEGLRVKGFVSNSDDEFTKRIRNNVKQGILKALSVGIDDVDENVRQDGINEIKSAELVEISLVGIPMNQNAIFDVTGKTLKQRRLHACKMLDLLEAASKKSSEEKVLAQGETGPSSSEGDDHKHVARVETQNGNGTATTVIGEHEPHTHDIEDGEVKAGGADNHTHSLDMNTLKVPDETPDENTQDKTDKEKQTDSMVMQSLIFSKEKFDSAEKAQAWAKEHNFQGDKVDENDETFRLRQRDPADFKEDSLRTIDVTEGIKAVVGKLKEGSVEVDDDEDKEKHFSTIVINRLWPKLTKSSEDNLDEIVMLAVEDIYKSNKKIKISRKHYPVYFSCIDALYRLKQAEQPQTENTPTTPVQTDVKNGELESPFLDQAKQTNTLLGSLIREMQLLRDQVSQLGPRDEKPEEEESEEENRDDKSAEELLSSEDNDNIKTEGDEEEDKKTPDLKSLKRAADLLTKYTDDYEKRLGILTKA